MNAPISVPSKGMEYCPYERAAKQMKELMGDSFNSEVNATIFPTQTKEFTNDEWDQYVVESFNHQTSCQPEQQKSPAQKDNQVEHLTECSPITTATTTGLNSDNNYQTEEVIHMEAGSEWAPGISQGLKLSDFPKLNQNNGEDEDESQDEFE